MSTATLDRGLYAVPEQASTSRGRFAALLVLRAAARRLTDKALTLPRAAAG